MIEGVRIAPLKQIPDERGKIMHMLAAMRRDSPALERSIFPVYTPGP